MIKLNQSVFFETELFTKHFPTLMVTDKWSEYDYVGTISWKAHIKFTKAFNFGMFNLSDAVTSAPPNVDVIALVGQKNPRFDNMLNESNKNHHKFAFIWTELLSQFPQFTPEQVSTDGMIPFYCNYWLAKPQHVIRFIPFMERAQHLLTNLTSIQEALWSNPRYVGNKHVAKSVFGRKYYAYHPFILERLTPFFFNAEHRSIYVYKHFKNITQLKKKKKKRSTEAEEAQDEEEAAGEFAVSVVKDEGMKRKYWPQK